MTTFLTHHSQAKKKVALLLQQLKKYELPELPSPRHDPELLTPEQLQAYKKIGFRNKNYVPVGVRGVFGGVVQNMHLHWKFHETVQVCCDNFPKEKIKEMATMLARLSGGIVVNIHNVKTIIMFRGRNYRQPKNLIPINTLTKRKVHILDHMFVVSVSLLYFFFKSTFSLFRFLFFIFVVYKLRNNPAHTWIEIELRGDINQIWKRYVRWIEYWSVYSVYILL